MSRTLTATDDAPASSRRGLLGLVLGVTAAATVMAPAAAQAAVDVIDGGTP